jgi:hypothetical protein
MKKLRKTPLGRLRNRVKDNIKIGIKEKGLEDVIWILTLKPNGKYMYHLLHQSIILRFAHKACLSISYEFQSKQRLFP